MEPITIGPTDRTTTDSLCIGDAGTFKDEIKAYFRFMHGNLIEILRQPSEKWELGYAAILILQGSYLLNPYSTVIVHNHIRYIAFLTLAILPVWGAGFMTLALMDIGGLLTRRPNSPGYSIRFVAMFGAGVVWGTHCVAIGVTAGWAALNYVFIGFAAFGFGMFQKLVRDSKRTR